ncbi:type I polyketide synthase, partial [Streptomyces fungicidicus]|uniref:type I polyketide synthase n=1 Tax=Streptomyces fungicidicus TaxID=68203 RepID=UPI00380C9005
LHRNHNDHHHLLTTLAHLHTTGHTTTWPTTTNTNTTSTPKLPTYPFQHHTHWLTPPTTTASPNSHPLLGSALDLADTQEHRFSQVLEATRPWFLEQHQLAGTAVMPAAAMLEWALAGVRAVAGGELPGLLLEDVSFNEFLHFGADVPVKVQVSVVSEGDGYRVRCFGRPDGSERGARDVQWAEHATVGRASRGADSSLPRVDLESLRREMRATDTDGLYERLWRIGVEYGPAYRGLKQVLRRGATEALALIDVGEAGRDSGAYVLHPVVLDASFHVVAMFTEGEEVLRLPVGLERVAVHGELPSRVWGHARWHGVGAAGECSMDLDLIADSGEVVVTIEGLRFRTVSVDALRGLAVTRPRRYEIEWQPFAPPEAVGGPAAEADREWLVISGRNGGASDGPAAWHGYFASEGVEGPLLPVDPDSELDLDQFFGERLPQALEALPSHGGGARPRLAGLVLDATAFAAADAPGQERDRKPDRDAGREAGQEADEDGVDGVDGVYRLARHSFLLLKHFLRAHGEDRSQVVIRSAGAAAVPGTPGAAGTPVLTQSVLTGVAKAVISDHPDIKCVQVDTDPAGPVPSLDETLGRVALLPGAGHLAVRGGRWYEARLTEGELVGGRPAVTVRPDGTYLVTGGLGGLGLEVARWLARQGARSLILVGRRAPADGDVPAEIVALRAGGVRVEVRQADVARRDDVARLFSSVRWESTPLRGVFHLAGVTDDAVFDKLTWHRVEQVLDPKVRGAWHVLQECARTGQEPESFVLFSSMTSLTGAAGQAAYVLANTVLDALAAHRTSRGLAALSVGWGAWAEVGMAARGGSLEGLASTGVDAMDPRQAFEAFERLGAGASAHLGLARMDWHRYAAVAARSVPYTLLDALRPQGGRTERGIAPASADELAALVEADPEQARDVVLGELLGSVALLLGLSDSERDALRGTFAGTRLNVLGLDSLTTVRLRSRLLADYSADVPSDLLFGGGTAQDIADFVCRQIALRSVLAVDDAGPDDSETEVLTL